MENKQELNSICSQLLNKNDINISNEMFKKVKKNRIVASILENNDLKSLKIFSLEKIHLSFITPILHDLGFEIIDEVTYSIIMESRLIYISKFNFNLHDLEKIKKSQENIEDIINSSLLDKSLIHSKVYSLVYNENFSMKKIKFIRAMIEYIDQAVLNLNSQIILNALIKHSSLTNLFAEYFINKFDPLIKNRDSLMLKNEKQIESEIKLIPNINDDKILNLSFSFLKCLLRTSYFLNKETISFKIDTKTYAVHLKGLQPNIENFIYHNDFYGSHLRMSKVSRGGLRWSTRNEDYREEIKSLMITQEGKNSIIIPDGSKGGFVINSNKVITKEYFEKIYSLYINANLDLVDNRVDGKILKNENMICYDEDDSYFVVAADKGTASMSDRANEISIKRSYWLGDAFASGGSNGYGHKDLGITAKGAIMSSKRFFIEKNIDIYKDEISVIALGSMKGDVFGNGMLESKYFKLIASISQKEIFIDPSPDIKKAYIQRKKLFFSNNASWLNYDKNIISKGGGVFLRADKNIILSPEIQKLLKSSKKSMSGEDLAKEILCLDVDMLFNAGVGTYVKASDENSIDIGDKQNEAVRVDANDLKAKIVCEGGNLGFTLKARVEYAKNGGKINLDAIDNAAGVHTSDNEVNLKILLNQISSITNQEKSKTLKSLTKDVVGKVLQNNYEQALCISIDEKFSQKYLNDFINVIEVLENNIISFNRKSFSIPKNENINEVLDENSSLVRPIISSLFLYSKILLKNVLIKSSLINERFFEKFLYSYFPDSFVNIYEKDVKNHALKNEIIATKMADFIINNQGCTFVSDYEKLGEKKFLKKIKAYLIVCELFDSRKIREVIKQNDYILDVNKQYKLINKIEYVLYVSARWMLKFLKDSQLDPVHILEHKKELFLVLKQIHNKKITQVIKGEEYFNTFYSLIDYLRFCIAAINIKESSSHSLKDIIIVFYLVLQDFHILEIISDLNRINAITKNDMKKRTQVLQFIEKIVFDYTLKILDFKRARESANSAFLNFFKDNKDAFKKVKTYLDIYKNKENKSLDDILITVNQLMISLIK